MAPCAARRANPPVFSHDFGYHPIGRGGPYAKQGEVGKKSLNAFANPLMGVDFGHVPVFNEQVNTVYPGRSPSVGFGIHKWRSDRGAMFVGNRCFRESQKRVPVNNRKVHSSEKGFSRSNRPRKIFRRFAKPKRETGRFVRSNVPESKSCVRNPHAGGMRFVSHKSRDSIGKEGRVTRVSNTVTDNIDLNRRKRKHEDSVLALSQNVTAVNRRSIPTVPETIEWGDGLVHERMGHDIDAYGSMEGILNVSREGKVLGLKDSSDTHHMISPVFNRVVEDDSFHKTLETNIDVYGSMEGALDINEDGKICALKVAVSPYNDRACAVHSNCESGEPKTSLQVRKENVFEASEQVQELGLKSRLTFHRSSPASGHVLGSFENLPANQNKRFKTDSLDALLSTRNNGDSSPHKTGTFFCTSDQNQCGFEGFGFDLDPYGSMSPFVTVSNKFSVDVKGPKGNDNISFLRSKIDVQEREISLILKENLSLRERVNQLEALIRMKEEDERERARRRLGCADSGHGGPVNSSSASPCSSQSSNCICFRAPDWSKEIKEIARHLTQLVVVYMEVSGDGSVPIGLGVYLFFVVL